MSRLCAVVAITLLLSSVAFNADANNGWRTAIRKGASSISFLRSNLSRKAVAFLGAATILCSSYACVHDAEAADARGKVIASTDSNRGALGQVIPESELPSAEIRVDVSKAIHTGDANFLATVLAEHGLQVNSVLRPGGYTLLHVAAVEGSPEIVAYLIKHGAEINIANRHGHTPLDEVTFGEVTFAKIEIFALLKQIGATHSEGFHLTSTRVTSTDQRDLDAALLTAAYQGTTEEVVRLLERGADIKAEDKYGDTPLMHAALSGKTEAVALLLKLGADIEAKDKYGDTPLMHAALFGKTEAVALLLKLGADIEAKNKYGKTPLIYAAEEGEVEAVALLLKLGANIEVRDNNGETALMYAANEKYSLNERRTEVAALLLKSGADIDAKDVDGWTPLMHALRGGEEGIIELLLERGADVEPKSNYGWTALQYAEDNFKEDDEYYPWHIVELLLEYGAY